MSTLSQQSCEACRPDAPRLTGDALARYQTEVPDWHVVERDGVNQLERSFTFDNFQQALDFTNRVGALAEAADHHPALLTEWGKVTVTWWSHKIGGLHKNDFVMAARTDELIASKE